MLNAIWRFLVFRLAGGRILLAITVLNWLRRRIAARRIAASQYEQTLAATPRSVTPPPAPRAAP